MPWKLSYTFMEVVKVSMEAVEASSASKLFASKLPTSMEVEYFQVMLGRVRVVWIEHRKYYPTYPRFGYEYVSSTKSTRDLGYGYESSTQPTRDLGKVPRVVQNLPAIWARVRE